MTKQIDIAIVGMACIFPGAPDIQTYWNNIVNKVSAISDPPPEAWDMDALYDPDSTASNRIYQKKGGFLGGLARFDPGAEGIPPDAIPGTEPDQWLALATARQALRDAGYGAKIPEREKAAVIIGRGAYINRGNSAHFQHGSLIDETVAIIQKLNPAFSADLLEGVRSALTEQLPPFGPTAAQGLIPNIIASRIANKLDLMGPAYTVDAACASAVMALDHAVSGLRSGSYDLAVVGGSYIVSPAPMTMIFSQLRALSRQGKICSFDANADGTMLGEGIGMVVLKRYDDAVRDGQPVYAVIKGVGVANDGRGRSVIAPKPEGALSAIQRAYANAGGVDPETVGLVEAHGIGTPVGDAVELEALHKTFGHKSADSGQKTAIGSVKPQIGHLMPASGVAGLIKASLALHHKVLPPTLNYETPHPSVDWSQASIYVNSETQEWTHTGEQPRRAAVNSFGFGGVSGHVVLEESPIQRPLTASVPVPEFGRTTIQLQTNSQTLLLDDKIVEKLLSEHAPEPKGEETMTTSHKNGAQAAASEPQQLQSNAPTISQPAVNGTHPLAPAMMASYTALMEKFLETQRDVMLAVLGSGGGGQVTGHSVPSAVNFAPPPVPVVVAPPTVIAPTAVSAPIPPVPIATPPVPQAPVAPTNNANSATAVVVEEATPEAMEAALVAIISDRTGYPEEMIEPDLDLEADLGIDSIKRVEVLGAFQKRFGDVVDSDLMDELTLQKSLREIVGFIEANR